MQNDIGLENKNIWANRSFITLYGTAFFCQYGREDLCTGITAAGV